MENNLKVTLGMIPENCMDDAVEIQEFSITYGQNADTNSDRDDYQHIKITAQNSGAGEDGWYYDIEIPNGHWSVDSGESLVTIIEDFKSRMEYNTTKEKDLKTYEFNHNTPK